MLYSNKHCFELDNKFHTIKKEISKIDINRKDILLYIIWKALFYTNPQIDTKYQLNHKLQSLSIIQNTKTKTVN